MSSLPPYIQRLLREGHTLEELEELDRSLNAEIDSGYNGEGCPNSWILELYALPEAESNLAEDMRHTISQHLQECAYCQKELDFIIRTSS